MSFKSFPLIRRSVVPSIFSAFVLLLCIATPLQATDKYLVAGKPDGVVLLAPPPLPGSPEYNADLASARAVFKEKSKAEEARAMKLANLTIFNFAPAIGDFFQPGKLPKTEAFFTDFRPEIKACIEIPKNHWKRERPYQVDSSLTLGKPEPSYSYPSGHSTVGTIQALLLAELFPDKRDAILAIGREIGWSRVLIGKHFPTDVHAGRVLAQAMVREMQANPTFQKDFAELKAEIAAVNK